MVLKRIDRYVGGCFLLRFGACMFLIGALYATFDMLKRLEELQREGLGRVMPALGAYYANLLPVFLLEIVPGIVLVSAGMVLVRMAKRGELLVLKACGTSLYRAMAPIFFWTLIISILVFAGREILGPRMARRQETLSRIIESKVQRHLLLSDPASDRRLFVREYDFATRTMKSVWILDFYPEGTLREATQSDSAAWAPGGALVLDRVRRQRFAPDGTAEPATTSARRVTVEMALRPEDFIDAAERDTEAGMSFHTLPELREGMRRQPGVPFFRVAFHSRLASFFAPLILLLVGCPCLVGFESSVQSRFLGVVVGIAVAGSLYGLTFVFTSMGNTSALNPVLAAWLPAIVVGAVGLWLFESMRT
ncbi:MAG: LptF/LptG family permease [Planctomycetota bacterium]|jgi:lipopolysaccharide export system permease protein